MDAVHAHRGPGVDGLVGFAANGVLEDLCPDLSWEAKER